jgi:hypothetical protein
VNNVKLHLREIWRGRVNWLDLGSGQEPVEGSSEYGNEILGSKNVGKLLSGCTTGGFSTRTQPHEVSSYGPSAYRGDIYCRYFGIGYCEMCGTTRDELTGGGGEDNNCKAGFHNSEQIRFMKGQLGRPEPRGENGIRFSRRNLFQELFSA